MSVYCQKQLNVYRNIQRIGEVPKCVRLNLGYFKCRNQAQIARSERTSVPTTAQLLRMSFAGL